MKISPWGWWRDRRNVVLQSCGALAWWALVACRTGPEPRPARPPSPLHEPLPPWQEPLGRGHPLLGRLWSASQGVSDPTALVEVATSADYVLLGEKHDNADHHRLQAWVVGALVGAGRRPTVAFEMIDADQQPALDAYVARPDATPAGLGAAVGWTERGWPAWATYQGIAERALAAHLPLVAANAPTADVRRLAWQGPEAVAAETRRRWGIDRPLPAPLQTSLLAELAAAHCGQLPPAALTPMALAQRARDAEMADRLVTFDRGQGAVLVAGAGHTRRDRGVPRELRERRPRARIVSVAFTEVRDGVTDPAAYTPLGDAPVYDFFWFTPRKDDTDPCEKRRGPADTKG